MANFMLKICIIHIFSHDNDAVVTSFETSTNIHKTHNILTFKSFVLKQRLYRVEGKCLKSFSVQLYSHILFNETIIFIK